MTRLYNSAMALLGAGGSSEKRLTERNKKGHDFHPIDIAGRQFITLHRIFGKPACDLRVCH